MTSVQYNTSLHIPVVIVSVSLPSCVQRSIYVNGILDAGIFMPFYIQRKTSKSCTFLYNFCRNMSELNLKSFVCTYTTHTFCMVCTTYRSLFMNKNTAAPQGGYLYRTFIIIIEGNPFEKGFPSNSFPKTFNSIWQGQTFSQRTENVCLLLCYKSIAVPAK